MSNDELGIGLEKLFILSNAESRSISAENFKGEKGKGGMTTEGTGAFAARELGQGWKVSPSVIIKGKSTFTIAEIDGPGIINHIWFTSFPTTWRYLILRIYWDGENDPSVEVPLGDFFCNGWCEPSNVNSLPIVVNPSGGFNSYWVMPFHKSAKITIQNISEEDSILYYQIDYSFSLSGIPDKVAYFHAQFRRNNCVDYKEVYTILDGVEGQGSYVGTYMAHQVNNNGWWGEGEVKFYLDGDSDFPTICGTGTEDYFGGAWDWEQPKGQYCTYSTPFLGMHQFIKSDGLYRSQQRFGMYRWHIMDPIRFQRDLKVTIQLLGWRTGNRYLPLRDDVASVAYWYQTEPHAPFYTLPSLLDKDHLEVI